MQFQPTLGRVFVCVSVRVCECACVHACMHACVHFVSIVQVGKKRFREFEKMGYRQTDGWTDGRMDGWTDSRMNGRTDTPSYRDARTHLKTKGRHDNIQFDVKSKWLKLQNCDDARSYIHVFLID